MPKNSKLDAIEGSGSVAVSFEELDMRSMLKIRGFIEICMPPIFEDLNRRHNFFSLRKKGVTPIMFSLDFHAPSIPVAFGRHVTSNHKISVHRSVSENPKSGKPVERLLLNMESILTGPLGSGDASTLGFEPELGKTVEVGRSQVLQVLTKPLAPPGERQVTEIPEELSHINEQPWDAPYPSTESLHHIPEGFTETDAGTWGEYQSIWGMPNTDINQHVNVREYIINMENHHTRMLFGAGLPVASHRITRGQFLFRKPFFPGEVFTIQGQLFTKGEETVFEGAFYKMTPENTVDTRPSVFVRFEGNTSGN